MIEALLAFGLSLSTATQFGLGGSPIGPGVTALVLWIILMVVRVLLIGTRRDPRPGLALVVFWSAMALALGIGMIAAMLSGELFDAGLALHDVAAYILLAALSGLWVAAPLRLPLVCWLTVGGSALWLSLQLLSASGLFGVSGIDPWYWDRLRGWSDNPNQLAIGCLIVALLALHLADAASRPAARAAALLFLMPPLIAGRLSQSDTFTVAVTVAILAWAIMKWIAWIRDSRPQRALRAASARLAVLAVPVILMSVGPLLVIRGADVKAFALGFAKEDGTEVVGELALRRALWHAAFERGLQSGMLGFGPGPHLQIPAQIAADHADESPVGYHSVPPQNGTPDFESHNTLLDLFTQGGLLAVGSFLWLLIRAVVGAWRARTPGLVCVLIGLMIFMMTGNIIRQPLVWFAVALGLTASDWPCAAAAHRSSRKRHGVVQQQDLLQGGAG